MSAFMPVNNVAARHERRQLRLQPRRAGAYGKQQRSTLEQPLVPVLPCASLNSPAAAVMRALHRSMACNAAQCWGGMQPPEHGALRHER